MRYTVRAKDLGKIKLIESDRIAAILQRIAIIMQTPQRSVPLDRRLGLPMRFVDKPINVAQTIIVAEVGDAMREYVPEATITNITFEIDENVPGKLIPIVEVDIEDEP